MDSLQRLVAQAIAAVVAITHSSLASQQGPAEAPTPLTYWYFKEERPLELDQDRIAVLHIRASQAQWNEFWAVRGGGVKVTPLPMPGWSVVEVPQASRSRAGIESAIADLSSESVVEFATPVFIGRWKKPVIFTNELIVAFGAETAGSRAEATLYTAMPGFVEEREFGGMKDVYRFHAATANGIELLTTVNQLAQRQEVRFAEPNAIQHASKHQDPNDPYFPLQWALENTGVPTGLANCDLDALGAWSGTQGNAAVKIAILDDGVQQDHSDIHQIPGVDMTTDAGNGGPVNVCDNHGTAVAGCATAAINNGLGVVGIAPGCVAVSVRFAISDVACNGFGSLESTWVVNGLAWAQAQGARITNTSWGFGFESSAIAAKYLDLYNANVVNFASAGNDSAGTLSYPAKLPSVFAVGAMTRDGTLASFSNYGNGLRFVAPGQDTWSTDRTGPAGYVSGSVTNFGGTSAASPYAAGVAALVLSVNPGLTSSQILEVLAQSAKDFGSPGYDTYFGHGMVNAARAVQRAGSCVPKPFQPAFLAQHHDVGSNPRWIASGDMNADGRPDLVTANANSSSVSLLLTRPDGVPDNAKAFAVGSTPMAVLCADVNGDGHRDMVSANNGSASVSIYFGLGGGSFSSVAVHYAAGVNPTGVVCGDLNGDAKPDLVVTNDPGATCSVLLNNGSGGFAAPVSTATGNGPRSPIMGDFDGDGDLDVVHPSFGLDRVDVRPGNGSGSLGAPVPYDVGGDPWTVKSSDVNKDGKLDLVTSNSLTSNVSVLTNTGAGGFALKIDYALSSNPHGLEVEDVNGDSNLDLIVSVASGDRLYVRLGVAGGGFGAMSSYPIGASTESIVLADLDLDGKRDVAGAITGENTVCVLRGTGLGTFAVAPWYPVGGTPKSVQLADLDNDSFLDIIATSHGTNAAYVWHGDGSGGFAAAGGFAVGVNPVMSTTGDFNLDGTLDIATANADSNSVSVLLANGSGGYAPKADYGTAANCSSVVSADANADGKLDLWTVNANAKTLSLLQGDGLGSFTKIGDFGTGERSVNLAVADVNGDGRMDFVSSNHDTANVTVRFGDGALGFGPIAYYAVGSIPYGLAIADLNLDNKPDIAVANVGSGSVSVLYGTGSGVFGPSVGLPTGTGWQPRDVKITDVNGDGRQDLLVANYSTVFQGPNAGAVAVLLGRNACGFLPIAADGFELPVNYHIGGGPSRVAIGDLDANGTMDVVAPNSDAGSIAVLLNQIAQPAGLALYGAGTSGCSATLALSANSAPKVNHADFALTATNAPPLSLGLGLVTSGQDLYGTDPYGIGVKLHVDLFGSPEAFPFDCVSGPSGTCFLPVPIPDLPQLGGATYFFQTIWIESAGYRCSSSSVGLVSSRGLMLTIQP